MVAALDQEIDAVMAARVQALAESRDQLLVWTITWGTSDHGEHFIARPFLVAQPGGGHLAVHLAGESLDDIRGKLPPGLTRMPPDAADDPVIVEAWL